MTTQTRLPGLVTVEHRITVPLVREEEGGETIEVFAREVATPDGRDKPFLVFLQGGPSHIEFFDPKMTAPDGVRSITGEVQTSLSGVTFGGTFPKLAKMADRIAVVRSIPHSPATWRAAAWRTPGSTPTWSAPRRWDASWRSAPSAISAPTAASSRRSGPGLPGRASTLP